MSDMISREEAIDSLTNLTCYGIEEMENLCSASVADSEGWIGGILEAIHELQALPSVEPERIIKIGQRSGKTLESAIDYLHSVGWLQEHDRILTESAEPEKWTPVTEALPEENEEVLVTVRFDGTKDVKPSVYVETASQIGGTWTSYSDEWKVARSKHHVIAWMLLPESYKGD